MNTFEQETENHEAPSQNFVREHLSKALYWGSASCPIPIPKPGQTTFGNISMPPPILNPYHAIPQEQRSYYTIPDEKDHSNHADRMDDGDTNAWCPHIPQCIDLSHPQCNDKIPPAADSDMEENEDEVAKNCEELIPTHLLTDSPSHCSFGWSPSSSSSTV